MRVQQPPLNDQFPCIIHVLIAMYRSLWSMKFNGKDEKNIELLFKFGEYHKGLRATPEVCPVVNFRAQGLVEGRASWSGNPVVKK